MPSTKRKTKQKKEKKYGHCSICNSTDHRRNKCPDLPKTSQADELQQYQLVVDTQATKDGEVLPKCKFPSCKSNVDGTGYGPYCTWTCMIFDQQRKAALSKAVDKYESTYANEHLHAYLKLCERSHMPFYAKVNDTLVPVKRTEIPSVAGFATFIGFAKVTLKGWANRHPEFRKALLILKQVQEYYLTNYGGTGVYSSKVVVLLLMNNHGMKDRSERTVNNLFGVVREVYEQADAYEQDGALDDPLEGVLGMNDDDQEYI